MPKVSIVSPTYNHEKYVGEAIQSVLNQTYQDFELIMADDASTDQNVKEILKFQDPRILLLHNERNEGITAASARCWQHSKGEYIIGFATDDVYEPNLLETLVNYLDHNPQTVGVFGLASYINDDSKLMNDGWTDVGVGQDRFTHLRQLFKLQHPFCAIAGMFRRSALEELGYFPPYLRQANDMSQFIRLLFYGEMPILPDKILRYRWRANEANVSARTISNDSRLDFELFEILDLYRENIDSPDLLRKIFPEVDKHPWPLDQKLITFHLAQVAITFGYPSHRLYGLHLLYQLLKDANHAKELRERCNFTYNDFFQLAGEQPTVMNFALYTKNAELTSRIESLNNELQSTKATLEEILERLAAIPSGLIRFFGRVRRVASLLKARLQTHLNSIRQS